MPSPIASRALWIAERTPVTEALATDAMRRFGGFLERVIADGQDREAREQCLIASWQAGVVLTAGTALHHKLAHVLGGFGLPHAETHAIILPRVTRSISNRHRTPSRALPMRWAAIPPTD